jgi:hypothetical protein
MHASPRGALRQAALRAARLDLNRDGSTSAWVMTVKGSVRWTKATRDDAITSR